MSRIFIVKEITLTLKELLADNPNPTMLLNSLAENGIYELSDLLETSDAKLRRMPNIGVLSHIYLVDNLAEHGLHLKVKQ